LQQISTIDDRATCGWSIVVLRSDRCGAAASLTSLTLYHHLVDSPRTFGLNNRRTMQRFSAQARLKRE
jgi:hypothetical protein